jgi:hypothetical protein
VIMKIDQPVDVAAHNSNGDQLRNRMMDRFGPKFETQLRPDAKAAFVRAQAAPLPTPATPASSATVVPTTMLKPPQSPTQKLEPVRFAVPLDVKPADRGLEYTRKVVFAIAIGLAIISGIFSVAGMARIFPGAQNMVIGMAILMELGKVGGATWLSRTWCEMGFILRGVLMFLIATLAVINAIGVFGQLSAAHLNAHAAAASSVATKAVVSNAEIEAKVRQISDLTKRVDQIDATVAESTKRGRTDKAVELAKLQHGERALLVDARNAAERELIELKKQAASVAGEQQQADADVGVLQYAANLFGVDREWIMQLLILAMTWSCDPLSITLVIATASRRRVA